MIQIPVNGHILVEVQKNVSKEKYMLEQMGFAVPKDDLEFNNAQEFSVVEALSMCNLPEVTVEPGDHLLVSTNMIRDIKTVVVKDNLMDITIIPRNAVWVVFKDEDKEDWMKLEEMS